MFLRLDLPLHSNSTFLDINTMSCPIIFNSNTIELTVQTSCYCGLRLTLCYYQEWSLWSHCGANGWAWRRCSTGSQEMDVAPIASNKSPLMKKLEAYHWAAKVTLKIDILQYWRIHVKKFTMLARLVRKYTIHPNR